MKLIKPTFLEGESLALNQSIGKKAAVGKDYHGQLYTLCFCAKICDKILVLNFGFEYIKVDESVLGQMVVMGKSDYFPSIIP